MHLTQPDDLTFAAEARQLRHESDAMRLAMSRRASRYSPMQHPEWREPSDEGDMLAASEAAEFGDDDAEA